MQIKVDFPQAPDIAFQQAAYGQSYEYSQFRLIVERAFTEFLIFANHFFMFQFVSCLFTCNGLLKNLNHRHSCSRRFDT